MINEICRYYRAMQVLAFTLMMFLASCTGTTKQMNESKPNIIYIMADDLGYSDLGCYGQKKIITPNIDKLAANGIRFTQHYSGSTVCAPSRCALLTGLHTGHCEVRGNIKIDERGDQPLTKNCVTVAEKLKSAGYSTAIIGKWGLGGPKSSGHPNKQGFEYFFGILAHRIAHRQYPESLWRNNTEVKYPGNNLYNGDNYANDVFTEDAIAYINQKDKSSGPFFLYLAFSIPHIDLAVPDENLNGYSGKFEETPFEHKYWKSTDQPRATYAAMVTQLDNYVGSVMKAIENNGLKENTIIIFTSDNGPEVMGGIDPDFFDSNGIYRGYKRDLYEGGVRVPFIVSWPAMVKAGTVSNHISTFWDFMPTACALACIDTGDGLDGISFLPELLGKPQKKHETIYFEFFERGGRQSILKDSWKCVKLNVLKPEDTIVELYNLANDPEEKNNIASQHPGKVEELLTLMESSRTSHQLYPFPDDNN